MFYNSLIERFFNSLKIPLVGFADLTSINEEARQGFNYGISLALPLYRDTIKDIIRGPNLDAFNAVNARNREIKEIATKGEKYITELGFHAFSQAFVRRNEQYETQLPHKTVATLAGIGFIGKSSLLITREYGAAVRLSSMLTDMPFKTAQPITESFCGECSICVDACPAGALLNHNWSYYSIRKGLINIEACCGEISKRGKLFNTNGGAICGVCVAVCPYSKKYLRRI